MAAVRCVAVRCAVKWVKAIYRALQQDDIGESTWFTYMISSYAITFCICESFFRQPQGLYCYCFRDRFINISLRDALSILQNTKAKLTIPRSSMNLPNGVNALSIALTLLYATGPRPLISSLCDAPPTLVSVNPAFASICVSWLKGAGTAVISAMLHPLGGYGPHS
jgi:hypothetical protein